MEYDLNRFVEAQNFCDIYSLALEEMVKGHKRSHWMWYIFPQMASLGHSYNATYYGISGLDEAKAYLEHGVLNTRLRTITQAMLSHHGVRIEDLMGGGIDAAKLRSSMTLFDIVSPNDIYAQVLDKYFGGIRCHRTLKICKGE